MACGGGQVPISCSLCEDLTIKWKCLNCDMLMCDKCKEKIHVKFKFAKNHKVVSIQEVGHHVEEIDFSNISCNTHECQTCVLFCKSCGDLVCPLCISETHNGHGLVTMKEGYKIRISKFKTGGKNIETNIHKLEKRKAEIKDFNRAELSKFENNMKKIKDQNVQLKKEVDQHTEKLETELIKKWENLYRCTEKEEKDVSLLIGSLAYKKSKVDGIIQSMDVKKVFVDSLGLEKTIDETTITPCTKFDSIPTFLPGQKTVYNVGSLENVPTRDEIKIVKQFDTEIANVNYMASCSEDTFLKTNQNILQKDDKFHLIADKEVSKSLTEPQSSPLLTTDPNMTSSMTISTADFEKGEVISQNEIWIKPGKTFAVPILVDRFNTTLCWEFNSHPKDVVFGVHYQTMTGSSSEVLIPPCKVDSHKQYVKGELTAKQLGIYSLIFDNTYSRFTSKKIIYKLWSNKGK